MKHNPKYVGNIERTSQHATYKIQLQRQRFGEESEIC